jgi:DNA-binding NtrC family response regulator
MEPVISHVLVVDSDHLTGRMVERTLIEAGYLVTRMEEPVDALVWAFDDHTVDLVIAGLTLSVVSGPVLAQSLWLKRPEVPFIYMAHREDQIPLKQRPGQAFEHIIPKPFGASDLLDLVSTALAISESAK